jgi:hypothetical protein
LAGGAFPIAFASRTDHDGETQAATIRLLHAMLLRHFPQLQGVEIDHGWCGVLGVPRDWCATVGLDPATRIGWAGAMWGWGFPPATWPGARWPIWRWGGHSALTALPWVNRRVRAWEPEPLRWLAVNGLYAAYRRADRQEEDGRPGTAPLARLADRLVGR